MKKLSEVFTEEHQEKFFIVERGGIQYPIKASLPKASTLLNKGYRLFYKGEEIEDDLGYYFEEEPC